MRAHCEPLADRARRSNTCGYPTTLLTLPRSSNNHNRADSEADEEVDEETTAAAAARGADAVGAAKEEVEAVAVALEKYQTLHETTK
jgi:hypothetical protein